MVKFIMENCDIRCLAIHRSSWCLSYNNLLILFFSIWFVGKGRKTIKDLFSSSFSLWLIFFECSQKEILNSGVLSFKNSTLICFHSFGCFDLICSRRKTLSPFLSSLFISNTAFRLCLLLLLEELNIIRVASSNPGGIKALCRMLSILKVLSLPLLLFLRGSSEESLRSGLGFTKNELSNGVDELRFWMVNFAIL